IDLLPVDSSRRKFLARCCQGALATLLPRSFFSRLLSQSSEKPPLKTLPNKVFHLQPKYRAQLPIEPTLLKVDPTLDRFRGEKNYPQIASVLKKWSVALLGATPEVSLIAETLAPEFRGVSWRSTSSRTLRGGPIAEAYRRTFDNTNGLGRREF